MSSSSAYYIRKMLHPTVIEVQPLASVHPAEFIGIDHLAVLLDEDKQGTPGFEILADSNMFEIKRMNPKESWENNKGYGVLGENKQMLLVARKEAQLYCCSIQSVIISASTDVYRDPVFITNINYGAAENKRCSVISTSAGLHVGSASKHSDRAWAPLGNVSFLIRNEIEDLTFHVTSNMEEDCPSSSKILIYDIWNASQFMGNITRGAGLLSVYTVGSLTCETKGILLGFAFYLDGIEM